MKKLNASYEAGILTLEYCGPEDSGWVIKHVGTERSVQVWSLYEIPRYGGHEMYYGPYATLDDAITETESWT